MIINKIIKDEIKAIGKNSSIYIFGRILSQGIGFFMIPIYTRYISPEKYGAMDLVELTAAIVMMIIAMGVGDSMSRFYYEEENEKDKKRIISTILIGFGIIALPLIILLVYFSDYLSIYIINSSKYNNLIKVAIITVWFGMYCEIVFTYLRMLYMAKIFVIATTAQLFIALTFNIIFVVYYEMGIVGIFYSNLISQTIIGSTLLIFVLNHVGIRFSYKILKKLIKFGLPLVPSRISQFLGFSSNRFFLTRLGSPDLAISLTMVGIFSLGNKFGVIVSRFVTSPFNSFWGPRRMEILLQKGDRDTVAKVCTYAVLLTMYIALGISTCAQDLIYFVADKRYQEAYVVVPFIALAYVVLSLEWHFSAGIILSKRTIFLTYTSLCSLIIVILWNYFLIPKWGLIAAATSNLAGFTIRTVTIYFISNHLFKIPFEIYRIIKIFFTAIIVYIVCIHINLESAYSNFIARFIVSLFFPFYLLLFHFYDIEELNILKKFIKKNTPSYYSR